jgi:eukaryotic-like serine/threonine-protein kinase
LRLAAENTSKAYELRDRVSEPERLMISAQYFLKVTEQPEKVLSICQLWSQGYPADGAVHERTSWAYMELGQHEKALAESLEAHRKRGNLPITDVQLAHALLFLNRIEDARKLLDRASALNPDQLFWHEGIYLLGFLDGNTKRMEEQVDWAMHTPGAEDSLLSMAADTNAYFGRLEKAREVSRLAVEFARRHEFQERAAMLMAAGALREAWLDNAESARVQARVALNLLPGKGVRTLAALALARAGDAVSAGKLADQLDAESPSSALIHHYWLPAIRAQVEHHNGHYNQAIELLRTAAPYDLADTPAPLTPVYIRAEALLGAHKGDVAAAEFQKILDHRGIVGNSPVGALAHLGSARAYALSGEVAKARREYQKFLALWKDADANVPTLTQAKAEYLKLK